MQKNYKAHSKSKVKNPTLKQSILQSFPVALMFASFHVVAAIQATFT